MNNQNDAHSGLAAARQATFPGVPWQRCQLHLQQNAQAYVPKQEMKPAVAAAIRCIFDAPDRMEADRLLEKTIKSYEKTAPKLAAWLAESIPEGLTVFAFPKKHRRRIRTSNILECVFKIFAIRMFVLAGTANLAESVYCDFVLLTIFRSLFGNLGDVQNLNRLGSDEFQGCRIPLAGKNEAIHKGVFGHFSENCQTKNKVLPNNSQSHTGQRGILMVAIPVTGRRTFEARPPAIWFRASKSTTIKPSDQMRFINPILQPSRTRLSYHPNG
jgi:hypothetical protein